MSRAFLLAGALTLSACAVTPPMTPEEQVVAFGPLLPAPSEAVLEAAKILNYPRLLQRPTLGEMHAGYPRAAWVDEAQGRVVLDCIVQPSGRLACRAEDDGQPKYDFETSALLLSSRVRVGLVDENGESAIGRRLRLPMAFRLY